MRAGVSAATVAAVLLGAGTAFPACPPGQSPPSQSRTDQTSTGRLHTSQSRTDQSRTDQSRTDQSRNCLDLNLVPQITQQIVAGEHLAVPPKMAPAAESKPAYTGPTVGLSRTVRQAPTVGYRWSID
jgi:hypothetical protein